MCIRNRKRMITRLWRRTIISRIALFDAEDEKSIVH